MATISDVARASGVSRTSVSFAFNDPQRLSAATLQRILAAAEELGYYPNAAARTLTTKRTGTLGLLIPQRSATVFANPFFPEFMRGIGEVCDSRGFSLLLVPPIERSLRRAVNMAMVDGYIVLGLNASHSEVRLLARRGVPFVVVDGEPMPEVPCVNVDDVGGADAAADHLLARGHRTILILGIRPPDDADERVEGAITVTADTTPFSAVVQRRLAGYRQAFARHGHRLDMKTVINSESTFEGGAEGLRLAWAAGLRPTAILAMSDVLALGALQTAIASGLDVPGDLEIVGFDDIALSGWTTPPLSTVHQPTEHKGRKATTLLLEALGGANTAARQITLPTYLVLRGSTRDLPHLVAHQAGRSAVGTSSSTKEDGPLVPDQRREVSRDAVAR